MGAAVKGPCTPPAATSSSIFAWTTEGRAIANDKLMICLLEITP